MSTQKTISFGRFLLWLLGIFTLTTILFQTVFMVIWVPTESMEPTISPRSLLLCSRYVKDVDRGDIVVFRHGDAMLIKRVIGCPGESIVIDGSGAVSIDGKPLEEPYVHDHRHGKEQRFTVPADSYLLLGDNRPHSHDARFWEEPYISRSDIVAKPFSQG